MKNKKKKKMKVYYVMMIIVLFLVSGCNTHSGALYLAYCKNMGYETIINDSGGYCKFNDNTSCKVEDFYYEICGEDKMK